MPSEVYNKYIAFLEAEKNASPYTVRNYTRDLLEFFDFVTGKKIESLKDVNKLTLRAYLAHLMTFWVSIHLSRRARARTMVFNPMGTDDGKGGLDLFYVGAWYDDKLVRTPEGWRIAERFEEQAFFDGALPKGLEIPE